MINTAIKLKTYEQLQFEVMRLITDNYLKQQELDQNKNNWKELKKWLNKYFVGTMSDAVLNKMKELEEKNND